MIAITFLALALACTGAGDHQAIEAALAQEAMVELSGSCVMDGDLYVPSNRRITGAGDARLWFFTGGGMRLSGGVGRVQLEGLQINSADYCIWAENGAGLWLDRVHCNGLNQGAGVWGLICGQWDTLMVSDTLFETMAVGLKLGYQGSCSNYQFSNWICDRCSVGIHGEPFSGTAENGQFSNVWLSGDWVAISYNAERGRVFNQTFIGLYITGYPNTIWINANVSPEEVKIIGLTEQD